MMVMELQYKFQEGVRMENNKKRNKSRGRKVVTVLGFILLGSVLLLIINMIPTLNLKTKDMMKLEGSWVNVYYENEKAAAEDVFDIADSQTGMIAKKLGFEKKQNVNIYIYDNQKRMQMKKYGLVGSFLGLGWYIGDNIGTDVILTSPGNPGPEHTYVSVKEAVLHEIVHAYISVVNPHIQLWLTEGMALYLSNGEPFYKEYTKQMKIPSYADTKTKNPIYFAKCGGYTFANTYIEYIDVTYGWDKVNELLKTQDYQGVLGKTDKEIYDQWVNYIENYPNVKKGK